MKLGDKGLQPRSGSGRTGSTEMLETLSTNSGDAENPSDHIGSPQHFRWLESTGGATIHRSGA